MTNKERLISLLGFSPPANSAEGALLDAGITDAGTYSSANSTAIKTVAIEVMKVLLTTANTTNELTGFSITYDRDALMKRIAQLEEELGLAAVSTIKGVKVW